MAGYSGTPLARKLGIKDGFKVLTVRAPDELSELLDPLPTGARASNRFRSADMALLFVSKTAEVESVLDRLVAALPVDGAIWICWPKKSSGVASELQSREVTLVAPFARGLVDIKVAAISDVWSGLKFVRRKELR
jgi:hypothetical protein